MRAHAKAALSAGTSTTSLVHLRSDRHAALQHRPTLLNLLDVPPRAATICAGGADADLLGRLWQVCERCGAKIVLGVRHRVVALQDLGDRDVAIPTRTIFQREQAREVQRCPAIAVLELQVHTGLNEHGHCIGMALAAGKMQERQAIAIGAGKVLAILNDFSERLWVKVKVGGCLEEACHAENGTDRKSAARRNLSSNPTRDCEGRTHNMASSLYLVRDLTNVEKEELVQLGPANLGDEIHHTWESLLSDLPVSGSSTLRPREESKLWPLIASLPPRDQRLPTRRLESELLRGFELKTQVAQVGRAAVGGGYSDHANLQAPQPTVGASLPAAVAAPAAARAAPAAARAKSPIEDAKKGGERKSLAQTIHALAVELYKSKPKNVLAHNWIEPDPSNLAPRDVANSLASSLEQTLQQLRIWREEQKANAALTGTLKPHAAAVRGRSWRHEHVRISQCPRPHTTPQYSLRGALNLKDGLPLSPQAFSIG